MTAAASQGRRTAGEAQYRMHGEVQGGKTCREIGAAKSFKEEVDNNDIWKVHQRAYKKYFARVSKGKMSKPDFEVWAREAERMRDEALAEDEMARDKAAHEQIVRRVTEELNRV